MARWHTDDRSLPVPESVIRIEWSMADITVIPKDIRQEADEEYRKVVQECQKSADSCGPDCEDHSKHVDYLTRREDTARKLIRNWALNQALERAIK